MIVLQEGFWEKLIILVLQFFFLVYGGF